MAPCPAVLVPFTAPCSGAGTCVDASTCACPEGWTGVSDWAIGQPTCAINVKAVQAMYSVLALCELLPFGFALFFILRLIRTKKTTKLNVHSLRSQLIGGGACVISCISFFALGITRATQVTELGLTIGSSPLVTVLFCLGASTFWVFILAFLDFLLRVSMNQLKLQDAKVKEHITRVNRMLSRGFPWIVALSVAFCCMPMFILATRDPWTVYALIFVHYEGLALMSAVLAHLVMPTIMGHVLKDIAEAIRRGDSMGLDVSQLKTVDAKLKKTIQDLKNQSLFNVFCASPFGVVPGLQQLGSYWTPVAFTAACFAATVSIALEMPVASKSTSSKPGAIGINDEAHPVSTMNSSFASSAPQVSSEY